MNLLGSRCVLGASAVCYAAAAIGEFWIHQPFAAWCFVFASAFNAMTLIVVVNKIEKPPKLP